MAEPAEGARRTLTRRWEALLGGFPKGRHPHYAAICEQALSDPRLSDPLMGVEPEQRRPNLLLAALHDLALAEPGGPLAPWYPTAGWLQERGGLAGSPIDPPSSPALPPGGVAAVLEVLREQPEAISERLAKRATQTNEVGRAAPLAFGLSQVRNQGAALALIDLGCSAGLNLLLDRYRIELGDQVLGDPGAELRIRSELRAPLRPLRLPRIGWRAGIDRRPLRASSLDDARWLLACQWPDDLERFERCRRALRAARDAQLELLEGDLVDELDQLASRAPERCHLVICCSWAAAYLSPDRQEELAAVIHRILERRASSWLWLEHPREVPGFEPPRLEDARIAGSSLLVLKEPGSEARILAQCQPHGAWLSPSL